VPCTRSSSGRTLPCKRERGVSTTPVCSNMTQSLEKTEDGIHISCITCKQIILINPNKYNERFVRLTYLNHMRNCNGTKTEQDNENIKF